MQTAMVRRAYPSDLSDWEWQRLEPLLPRARVIGRPRKVDLREVCNAILYVLDTGCGWRELPSDLMPWHTAYWWFRSWQQDGTLERLSSCVQRGRGLDGEADQLDREPALAMR
jgi:putative transposase